MLDGIGAKGGKKDFNQTLKNIKRSQQEQQLWIEEKNRKKQEELLEKKKKEISFSLEPPKKQENVVVKEKEISSKADHRIEEREKLPVIPISKEKVTLEESIDTDRIHSILKQISSSNSTKMKPSTSHDLKTEELDKPSSIEGFVPVVDSSKVLPDRPQGTVLQETAIENTKQEEIVEERKSMDLEVKQKPLDPLPIPQEESIVPPSSASMELEESYEQEEILEFKVALELERLLKNSRYELKKLYTELDAIQRDQDDLYEVSETEQAIEEIEKLLDYLEQIKHQLEIMNRSHNLDLIYQLEDPYFSKLVEEYKSYVKDQQTIEDQVEDFKKSEEYTSLMKKIVEFEEMQEELTTTLEDRKEELSKRDQNFELLQDQYLDLEKVNKDLEELIYDSQKYLEKVSKKVEEAVEVTTKAQIKMKYTLGVLARTLLLFSLIKMNPKPRANAVTAVEAIVAVDLIRNLLKPKIEKRMVTEYHCPDYRGMIENALSDIHSVSGLIQNGLSQVRELRETFEMEFEEYADILPEYKDLLSSITKIEKELKEREDQMKRVEKNMEHQLNKNNQKVLEYERLNASNCA